MNEPRSILLCFPSLACVIASLSATPHRESGDTPVIYTAEEVTRIGQHSPLHDAPLDATNRVAGDPAAARLGQFLFFDTRFSPNDNISCATCHDPTKGFSDGRRLSVGRRMLDRHAQSLWNMAHSRWYFWDGRADSLWSQALGPLEQDDEMGGDRTAVARAIFNDRALCKSYERVFGRMPDLSDAHRFPPHARPVPESADDSRDAAWRKMRDDDRRAVNTVFVNVGKAIAAYEARIISRDAPFDHFVEGLRENDAAKISAISESAQRGLRIFVGRGNCRLCHSGPNFTDGEFHSVGPRTLNGTEPTDSARYEGVAKLKASNFNAAGLFSDKGDGAAANRLTSLINKSDNWGQFKTPSLRSVALSPPYMHQGQYWTLAEVIEHYSTLADAGPAGLGHHREKILQPLNLTDQEKADLQAFLESLTGVPLPVELLHKPESP